MPPSQLKQLKASLRETGVLGPQKSRRKKKAESKDPTRSRRRNTALEEIRERFNPFEARAPTRNAKFEVTSTRSSKGQVSRPGVTRGFGEERRRETLLKEIQTKNKAGGLYDRRIGEDDPFMTPEEKAAQRYVRQNERSLRKNDIYNLEDEDAENFGLTLSNKTLALGEGLRDDYEETNGDTLEDFEAQDDRPSKRARIDGHNGSEQAKVGSLLQMKKSKDEIMKDIMTKSKIQKAERQAAKEDDYEMRLELDRGMTDFYASFGNQKPAKPTPPAKSSTDSEPQMNPARAAMLAGKSRVDVEKEYEENLRQLKLDARSKPSARKKAEEERAAEQAKLLQELEAQRIRRMRGEVEDADVEVVRSSIDQHIEQDDAEAFGLPAQLTTADFNLEDEDEFEVDENLVATDSDVELASEQDSDDAAPDVGDDDSEDDFINGLTLPPAKTAPTRPEKTSSTIQSSDRGHPLPCPQTHEELLRALDGADTNDLPMMIQRIRATHHKSLARENTEKLEKLAGVLTQHVVYLADNDLDVPVQALEGILRHIHSMAKDQPAAVAIAFRSHLEIISENHPLSLGLGDLMLLTSVGIIFPTSDHFHAVVTPAMLTIARYLELSPIESSQDLAIGAYCCSLALQYQRLSKRYLPEVIIYLFNALANLSPSSLPQKDEYGHPINIPLRIPEKPLHIKSSTELVSKKFSLRKTFAKDKDDHTSSTALLHQFLKLSTLAANLWQTKSAFPELIQPLIHAIHHITNQKSALSASTIALAKPTLSNLIDLQSKSIASRKPLLLHNHRPIAIKTSIPAFIEDFNPDKHYDPDQQRTEISKLKAENKRERRGAMRELRKDANFIARESLREKKEKDAAYEKKYKRLVAEIQGEEGREAKDYQREKMKRTGRW